MLTESNIGEGDLELTIPGTARHGGEVKAGAQAADHVTSTGPHYLLVGFLVVSCLL